VNITNAQRERLERIMAAHDAGKATVSRLGTGWYASSRAWSPYGPCETWAEAFAFAHYVMAPTTRRR
jgi:hypothetical protein